MNKYEVIIQTVRQYLFGADYSNIVIYASNLAAADHKAMDIVEIMNKYLDIDSADSVYTYSIR